MFVYRFVLPSLAVLFLGVVSPVSVGGGLGSSVPSVTEKARTNINEASAAMLAKVKGLSPAKAKAIVSWRKRHGKFKSLDELTQVRGMKKLKAEKLEAIQAQLTVS